MRVGFFVVDDAWPLMLDDWLCPGLVEPGVGLLADIVGRCDSTVIGPILS